MQHSSLARKQSVQRDVNTDHPIIDGIQHTIIALPLNCETHTGTKIQMPKYIGSSRFENRTNKFTKVDHLQSIVQRHNNRINIIYFFDMPVHIPM